MADFGADCVEDRFGKSAAYLYVFAMIFGGIALVGTIAVWAMPYLT